MSTKKFLTFQINNQHYALDILYVQELRSYEHPTRIANTPPFYLGVINLRGKIVGIQDLRLKCGTHNSYTDTTINIVIQVNTKLTVGLVVDGVSDVVEVDIDKIQPMPLGELAYADSGLGLTGLLSVEDRTLLIMDPLKMTLI